MDLVKTATILVVDHRPVDLGTLLRFFRDAGLTVLVAESGEGAIQKAEVAVPDIILLDVLMSDMDGFETCRRLKANPLTQNIPVMFRTMLSDTADKVRGLKLGAVDYVTKPLPHDELLARVETHLRTQQIKKQLQEQNARLEHELQERQRLGQEMEIARNRNIHILESITDAFFTLDSEWRFIYLNQQAEPLLQGKREELLGKCIWDEFPDTIGSRFYQEYHRSFAEQVSVSFEEFYQPQNAWFEVHTYPFESGLSVYVQDISDRKQAQEALQRQTVRAQLFSEVALKIRQSLDLSEILQTSVNEVQRIFGADRVLILQLLPNEWAKVVTEAIAPPWISVIAQDITDDCFGPDYLETYVQGRIYIIEDVNTAKVAPCLINFMHQFAIQSKLVVPILLRENLWGLLIAHQCSGPRQWSTFEIELLQQLSDQVSIALAQSQLLDEEKRQREELLRSNTELQQFAYVASHDLQEPLRMVTSYLQLLKRRYQHQLDSNADEFIAYAVDGATRMQTLINDLLAYSRVGTHVKPFESVDCMAVVDRVLNTLKLSIRDNEAVITYDDLPHIMADQIQLNQLFQNLIGNAIKFHRDTPAIVHITAERKADAWQFAVIDNGIGIEPQYLDRIFIIFQRLHNRAEYSGTGIGLAICKKIVERHGGRIWVQSTPGSGSTFYFTIPDRESTVL